MQLSFSFEGRKMFSLEMEMLQSLQPFAVTSYIFFRAAVVTKEFSQKEKETFCCPRKAVR